MQIQNVLYIISQPTCFFDKLHLEINSPGINSVILCSVFFHVTVAIKTNIGLKKATI